MESNRHWKNSIPYKEPDIIYEVVLVKPYSIKELCSIYNISRKTYSKWVQLFVKEVGPKLGRYYTVQQVEIIFCKLGLPYRVRGEG